MNWFPCSTNLTLISEKYTVLSYLVLVKILQFRNKNAYDLIACDTFIKKMITFIKNNNNQIFNLRTTFLYCVLQNINIFLCFLVKFTTLQLTIFGMN